MGKYKDEIKRIFYIPEIENRIFNEDCLDFMPKIESKKIDMIICDLPYNVTKNKWDVAIPFDQLWANYMRIIKDNGCIALFGINPFSSLLITSNIKMYKYDIVWEKTTPTGFLNAKKMPLRCHENIHIFYKNTPKYNPQKTYGHERKVSLSEHKINCVKTSNYGDHKLKSYDSTERYPRDVIKFKTDKQIENLHPTQKPVKLLEWLIKSYTDENMIVLDNCIGSGSTAIAALNTNRKYIGIEKDENYYNIACNRISKHLEDK